MVDETVKAKFLFAMCIGKFLLGGWGLECSHMSQN